MRDTDATLALPTFEGPRCRIHADKDGEAQALAAGIIGWLDKEGAGSGGHKIVVAHAADPSSQSVADALAHAIADLGSDCDTLETPLPPVTSHAILAGSHEVGILVGGASVGDRECPVTLFGADGSPLDPASLRCLRACAQEGWERGATKAGHLGRTPYGGASYLDGLADAFETLGRVPKAACVSVACVTPVDARDHIEAALSRMASTVEVVTSDAGADLDDALALATERALERGFDVALAFDDDLAHVACAAIDHAQATPLGDDEATELALAWLLTAHEPSSRPVTLVSDIGSTRAIDALAKRYGAALVRTLPGADAVCREVAHQRSCLPSDAAVVGITADAALLVAGTTGVPCPVALAMALTGAAADARSKGRSLVEELRAIDDELGCHRATRTTVTFETYDHAPLLMMRLRKDERDLVCHMVVCDTTDYLTSQPVPGDPTRVLPFFDAIGWTLSDGSTLILYADEAASCAHALILVRADTRPEAQAVSLFLAREAHAILTS